MLFCFVMSQARVSAQQTPAQDLGEAYVAFQKGDFKSAFWPLKNKAELGSSEAQYSVGWMYHTGQGVAKNLESAQYWYTLASNQGHASAQNNLCVIELTKKNYIKAISLCEHAAQSGNAHSAFLLGMIYYNGQGLPKNEKVSAEWLSQSAQSHYPPALYKLAFFYQHGLGVNRDIHKAQLYFDQASHYHYKNAKEHSQCLKDVLEHNRPEKECHQLKVY